MAPSRPVSQSAMMPRVAEKLNRGIRRDALTLLLPEETAPPNNLGDCRWHHLVPGFVAVGDAFEHVARKDRRIFGIIVIELHETAATDQITVERLQVGFHLDSVNGF